MVSLVMVTGYSNIVWRNIYYMLCYSVKYLSELNLTESDLDDTAGTLDLFSKLLIKSHEYSLKFGSLNDYNNYTSVGNMPNGKLNPYKSVVSGVLGQGKLCYTERKLDINTRYNKIIKCAYKLLIKADTKSNNKLSADTRKTLYSLYNNLSSVSDLDKTDIDEICNNKIDYGLLQIWNKPVISASIMIISNNLYIDSSGKQLILGFDDYAKLNHIFENFVRNYLADEFRKTKYGVISRPVYPVDGGGSLRLDILAQRDKKYLVIDTKWYDKSDSNIHNENQVYRYIGETLAKHPEFDSDSSISGMLLFAKTRKSGIEPRKTSTMMQSLTVPIIYDFVDLDKDFEDIKKSIYTKVVQTLDEMKPNIKN